MARQLRNENRLDQALAEAAKLALKGHHYSEFRRCYTGWSNAVRALRYLLDHELRDPQHESSCACACCNSIKNFCDIILAERPHD